ncbi:MAG: hypothetical protein WCH61_02230 [bacterium]
MLKVKRILSVGSLDEPRQPARRECSLTPSQRLALLEELRQQAANFGHEIPKRIPRVLEVAHKIDSKHAKFS